MVKNIIYGVLTIILFISCIYFGLQYFTISERYKNFVAAEYQRSCNYQEIIISSRNDISGLKEQQRRDTIDYKQIERTLDRERQNNRQLTEEIQQIREANTRAEGRERKAIKKLEQIIKKFENN